MTSKASQLKSLSKFHKQWFAPQNMSVILSGKVEGQMFDVVNNAFGKTPITGAPQQSATDSPSIKFKPDTVVVDKPDALQSAVRMGMPTVLRSDADYILYAFWLQHSADISAAG